MDQVSMLSRRLFDADALGATNFGITLGNSRDSTPEQVAGQVNRALSQLEAGEFVVAELD